jgi:hypothetical protein
LLPWFLDRTKENAMTTPRKIIEQRQDEPGQKQTGAVPLEESLGEQLLREAREGQAEFVAGWEQLMEELGIQGEPIGAKKLREMAVQQGVNPDDNEFSRGIVAMREE